jgi:hypothetical protein
MDESAYTSVEQAPMTIAQLHRYLALSLCSILIGCANEGITYYEDVKPILDARCVNCHADGDIAPFALDNYEDAKTYRGIIANAAGEQRMPPWFAVPDQQTYRNDPSLQTVDLWTLIEWANQGGQEGDPEHEAPPLSSTSQELKAIDSTLEMPEPYTPTQAPDTYRCFVLDWSEAETTYVTGFDASPGNLSIVHHMAAFLYRPDTLYGEGIFDILTDWDEAHDGPGYPCFGGPSGGDDVQLPIQQLAQWVPGMGATIFPEGTGIEVPPGSKVVLQIHYNLEDTAGGTDKSSIQMSLSDTVARRGAFAPWLDATWPLGTMPIAAGASETTYSTTASPYGLFEFLVPDMDLSNGFDIHSMLVHMHKLGESAEVSIQRADGSSETLLQLIDYDFDWQLVYELEEAIPFAPEDELSVSCTWDNSSANQPDGRAPEDINWGEGSSDEMCVANIYITERATPP